MATHREVLVGEHHVVPLRTRWPQPPTCAKAQVHEQREVMAARVDRVRTDPQKRVVVAEARVPAGVPEKAVRPGAVVEGADRGGTGRRADARAVAGARLAVGRRRDLVDVGDHRAFEDRGRRPLDAQVHGHGRGGRGRRTGGEQDERASDDAARAVGHGATPFLEGRMGCGRSQVSWLWALRRAFPENRRLPSGSVATHRRPFTVAGPRRLHTELPSTTGRMNGPHPTATHGQTRQPPLQSPADGPPSSRGLGRRPLTAETGVRIPVAVLSGPTPLGVSASRAPARSTPRPCTSSRETNLLPRNIHPETHPGRRSPFAAVRRDRLGCARSPARSQEDSLVWSNAASIRRPADCDRLYSRPAQRGDRVRAAHADAFGPTATTSMVRPPWRLGLQRQFHDLAYNPATGQYLLAVVGSTDATNDDVYTRLLDGAGNPVTGPTRVGRPP